MWNHARDQFITSELKTRTTVLTKERFSEMILIHLSPLKMFGVFTWGLIPLFLNGTSGYSQSQNLYKSSAQAAAIVQLYFCYQG